MICIPARFTLALYSGFLFFYFIPWNLKNMERADELERTIEINYGKVHSYDALGIAITQLFAFFCIVVSLVSIYKCAVVLCAPTRQTKNIWMYPIAILSSIGLSLFAHQNYHHDFISSSPSIFLFAHPVLAIFRGFIFYKILYSKNRPKATSSKSLSDDVQKPVVVAATPQSMSSFVLECSSKVGFVAYWCAYALLASVFYNEMGKFITEEHIDLATIMKFVLV